MGSGGGKKKKGRSTRERDTTNIIPFKRMNYLFQAAHHVLAVNPENVNLARHFITIMKTISKRLVLRIHPNIKRTICKKCNMLLIPGTTSSVRIKGKRQKHRIITCLSCSRVKRFVINGRHKLWIDTPESYLSDDENKPKSLERGGTCTSREDYDISEGSSVSSADVSKPATASSTDVPNTFTSIFSSSF